MTDFEIQCRLCGKATTGRSEVCGACSKRTCKACGRRSADPAWSHTGDLIFASEGDFEVTKCHRIMVIDPETHKLVPKFPSEDELEETSRG